MSEQQVAQFVEQGRARHPAGPVGTTDEWQRCLLPRSDESSYCGGIELFVDGGLAQV